MYKISVGISVYKQSKWLYRCLRSLASQYLDKNDYEVIIVNDDPDESIDEICNSLDDVININLIENEENIGLPSSLNKILTVARGRYFVRVDSDDYVSSHFLYALSLILDLNRDFQAVSSDYNKVDSVGNLKSTHKWQDEPIACGVMFTYESLCDVGFYNDSFKMREGHELMERYLKKFNLFNLPLPLYRYRIHEKNRTKNTKEVSKFDNYLEDQKS